MDLGVEMGRLHEEFDVPGADPGHTDRGLEAGVDVPAGSADPDWTSWTPYSYPFNLTQQPAISVPSGIVGGLPTAVQFVGARHHDATVLRVASAYEAAQPFPEVAR